MSAAHDALLRAPTLSALIEARAQATRDAPMLLDEHDRSVTFARYEAQVDETALMRRLREL